MSDLDIGDILKFNGNIISDEKFKGDFIMIKIGDHKIINNTK